MPALAQHPSSTVVLRQERFVTGLICGMVPADAYMYAGYKPKDRNGARAAGSRMLAREDVQQRLMELRQLAKTADVLTLQEKRAFLKHVVTTPISEVDGHDPACAKIVRTVQVTEDGTVEHVVVKMPDKLKALELDAKLAGELQGGGECLAQAANDRPVITAEVEERLARVWKDMLKCCAPT